tara:strand:+ start:37 stop:810 length:774 start_codon:yes stop_codon:yes gene_type:complete
MDIKTKIDKVISTYRITEDHMDNTWSNMQKALDKKSAANVYASLDPQLAMLKVLEYLMGDGNIFHPYEMYFNIDASEHRYQKQVGTTASGEKIMEDSDEVVPTGQLGTLRFIQPILESFHKKTRDGKDNSAIAQTLKVAGYQQAKALRDASLANKGAGTRDNDCIEHDIERSDTNTATATRLYEIQSVVEAWYKATQGEAFVPWSQKQAQADTASAEQEQALLDQIRANAKTRKVLSNQVTESKLKEQADEADGIDS